MLCLAQGLKERPQQDTGNTLLVGRKKNGRNLAEDAFVWRSYSSSEYHQRRSKAGSRETALSVNFLPNTGP